MSKSLASPQLYLLLFSLYWAQGLPVGFMTHALPVILRAQGVSLAQIGGFGLLMAPWALKVFWAPLVDQYGYQKLGHFRSWIIPTQCLSIVVLILLSFLPIQALNQPIYLFGFFIALFFMNMVGATQDIATDGLAVSILKHEQQHLGNMFQVIGSRLGFIVGGGAILWSLDWLNWQTTFLILAMIVFINTLPVLFYREPIHSDVQKTALNVNEVKSSRLIFQPIIHYLKYFFTDSALFWWLIVLCSIKVSDGLSGPIIKPLLVDLGLSFSQIGIYVTMLGAGAALCGAVLASWILRYIRRETALVIFSIFKIMSLFGFVWLAAQYEKAQMPPTWIIYVINALEDLFAAMLLVVILTLVMQYSRKKHAGTDFTFQVSIMATVSGGFYIVSGILGDYWGYQNYLMIIVLISILLLLPILVWKQKLR